MIINIQHGLDVITIDIRCNQIRYVKDIANHGAIQFYDMSQTEAECYEFLYRKNPNRFLEAVAEDATNNFEGVVVEPGSLKLLTEEEYLKLCNGGL
jgi:hypothetical protein